MGTDTDHKGNKGPAEVEDPAAEGLQGRRHPRPRPGRARPGRARLQVHLNEVILDITAVSGAGQVLGNLLCAVANLLNGTGGTGVLTAITGLLNQIITILNGLGV